MLFKNQVLHAIHDFCKANSIDSALNITPRVGVPCVGATPNVTIGRSLGVMCKGDEVVVWSVRGWGHTFEMADPLLMEKLKEAAWRSISEGPYSPNSYRRNEEHGNTA